MHAAFCRFLTALVLPLALAACGGGDPKLLNVGAGAIGPDEFSIVPGKPLEVPQSLAGLPEPTPGQGNLTDATPAADAVAALGGNPSAISLAAIPASDGALLTHSRRFGVQPDVRQELADADLALRKRSSAWGLQRLWSRNRYFQVYKRQSLNQESELERLRAAGIKTPSAPPASAR